LKHALDAKFESQLSDNVFRDRAELSIYGEIGADDGRAQKRLMIRMPDQRLKEITQLLPGPTENARLNVTTFLVKRISESRNLSSIRSEGGVNDDRRSEPRDGCRR